jgi:hypothetical protein
MKIFISQPMAGLSDEEIIKTREFNMQMIRMQLPQDADVEFIDSFTKPDDIAGNRVKMLGHSIMLLADADVCFFLPGWNESPGCLTEFDVCKRYGIKMRFMQEPVYNIQSQTEGE